jgi:hypothetical protein
LSAPGDEGEALFRVVGVGIEAEVSVGEGEFGIGLAVGIDFFAVEAVVEVDGVIGTPAGGGDGDLGVFGIVGVIEDFAVIGDVVTVGVFKEEDGVAGGDEEAAVQAAEALRMVEVIGPDGGCVDFSVAVLVGEEADAGEEGAVFGDAGIVAHFGDVDASGFVEGDVDGIGDEGFGGDEFELPRAVDFDGGEGFFRGEGKRAGEEAGAGFGSGLVGLVGFLKRVERVKFEAADEEFGAFGLEGDVTVAGIEGGGRIYFLSVEDDGERVVAGDDFDAVPIADRIFEIIFAAVSLGIGPVRIDVGSGGFATVFFGGDGMGGGEGVGGIFGGADDGEVAGAAFDELGFEGGNPRIAEATIGELAVEEDTAVAGFAGAVGPGVFAPFVFEDEVVIFEGVVGAEVSPAVAGDAEGVVFEAVEGFGGIDFEGDLWVEEGGEVLIGFEFEEIDGVVRGMRRAYEKETRWAIGFLSGSGR